MRSLRVATAVVGAGLLLCAFIAARAVRGAMSSAMPTHYAVPRPSGDAWFDSVKDIDLRTPNGVAFRGWLRGSANGSAIVFVHGSGADRRALLPVAQILSAVGFGVLVFDRPGNGESGGRRYREDEAEFVRVAVDTLAADPGLRPGGIGAYGFSSGAAFLAEEAATDARIRGVVLAGCYTEAHEYSIHFRGQGPLSGYPGLWTAEWAGFAFPDPLARVAEIAPRALFFIAGDEDDIVPSEMSLRLYARAFEPKDIWIVHGASHGDYERASGEEFGRRLVAFFDRALGGHEVTR